MIIPLKRKRITFEDTDPSTTLDTHIEFEDTDPSTTLDTHIEFEDTDPSTTLDTHIEFEDTDPSTTLDTHIEFEDTDSTTLDTQKTKSSTTWVKEKTNEFELNIFQRTIDKKYHVSAKFMQILINRLLKQTSKELDDNAFALTHLDPEYNICIQGLEKTINATVELKYPDILDKISSIKDVLIRFQFDTVGHLITIQYKQSSALWDHEWEMSSVVLTDEYKRNLKDCDKNPVINPDVAQLLISQVISFMTRLRYTISENIEGYAESINQRILRTTAGDQLNIKLTQLLKTLNNIKVLHRFVFRKNTSYLNDRNMRDNIGQTASHTKRQIVYDTADSGGYNPKYLPKKNPYYRIGFYSWYTKTEYETLNKTSDATKRSSSSNKCATVYSGCSSKSATGYSGSSSRNKSATVYSSSSNMSATVYSGSSSSNKSATVYSGSSYINKNAPVYNNSSSHNKSVTVSNNSSSHNKSVTVSNNSNSSNKNAPVYNNSSSRNKSVTVSNNSNSSNKSVTVSNNSNSSNKNAPVYNNSSSRNKSVTVSNNSNSSNKSATFVSSNMIKASNSFNASSSGRRGTIDIKLKNITKDFSS